MSKSKKHQKLAPGPVMVDVSGTRLTKQEKQRLRHPLVGGVILFARNFENRAQLTTLTRKIHEARGEPLLIAVDHEGGRVQRFREDGFTALPAMSALGQVWDRDPLLAMRLATEAGYVLAAELRACGVDMSFTPVLDLDYGVSKVIGNRALHRDPRVVAMLARALIQGLALAGMAACGKHFPGHGFVEADSHHEIPVDKRSLTEILREDAAPYGWLGDGVLSSVMPAHVIYPKVDSQPAGFSRRWSPRSCAASWPTMAWCFPMTSPWRGLPWRATFWPGLRPRWAQGATWCWSATVLILPTSCWAAWTCSSLPNRWRAFAG